MLFKKFLSHFLLPARFVFFGKTAAEHQAEMSKDLSELEAQAEGDEPKKYEDVKGDAESKLTAHVSREKGRLEGRHTTAREAEKAEVTALEEKIKAAKGDEKTKLEGELVAKKAANVEAEAARVKEKQELETNLGTAKTKALDQLQGAYKKANERREEEAKKEVPRLMKKVVQERAKRKGRRAEKRRKEDEREGGIHKSVYDEILTNDNELRGVDDFEGQEIWVDPGNKSNLPEEQRENADWGTIDMEHATRHAITAIYIAEGERAAERMAEQLHRATLPLDNGEDVNYDAFLSAFAVDEDGKRAKLDSKGRPEEDGKTNGRGSVQYTVDENVCPANLGPKLTGRTWGFMYSANKILEKDDHFDAYQEYLSEEVRKKDADPDDLMSPAEWLAENDDKLAELSSETPDDPGEFLDDVLQRVDDDKAAALKSMLMAVLRTEKDPKKWDYTVSEALAKITGTKVEDLDLDDLDDINMDQITARWGKDILKESELELSEKAKKYVAGLLLGAEMKYGGDKDKMEKYHAHLKEKFKDPEFQKSLRRLDSKFRRKMAEASKEDEKPIFGFPKIGFGFEDSDQMKALKEFDEDVQALLEEELEDVVTFEGVKKKEELDEEQKKRVIAVTSEYAEFKKAAGDKFVLPELEALDPEEMKPEEATEERIAALTKALREAATQHMEKEFSQSIQKHEGNQHLLLVMTGATAKRMSPHYARIAAKLRTSYQEAVGSKAKVLENPIAVKDAKEMAAIIPQLEEANKALEAWREEHKDDLAKVEGYFPKVDEWEKKHGITHGGKQGAPSGGGARPAPGAAPGGARPAPRPAPGGSPRPAPQPAPAPSPERKGKDPEVGDPQDERPDGFQDQPVAKAPAWMGKAHKKMERPGYYVVKRGDQTLLAYRKPGHQGGEISFEHYDPEKKTG